jgi:hypothetical protein
MIAELDMNGSPQDRGQILQKVEAARISRAAESLKESASKVASSANTIIGSGSTTWEGSERDFAMDNSVCGEPLTPGK